MQECSLQIRKNLKVVAILTTMAFVIIAIFGINFGMDMREDGTMTGCMFDHSAVCPMSYTKHIAQWQHTFIVISETNNLSLFILLLLLFGVISFAVFSRKTHDQFIKSHNLSTKICKDRNNLAKLFDYFLQALSDGIINPKVYDSSYITY